MKKKKILNVLLVLLILGLYVTPAFAQIDLDQTVSGDNMLDGVNTKIAFVIDYVLPLFGVLGIGLAAGYLYFGHPEGTKKVWTAIAGLVLLGIGPKLVFWALG